MLKVLIADDNEMLGDLFEDYLSEMGFDVIGVARTVRDAVDLAVSRQPHIAIVDYRLGRHLGTDIIRQLPRLSRPAILYLSGEPLARVLTKADGEGFIQKPVSLHDLARALPITWEIRSNGFITPQPVPAGFRLLNSEPAIAQRSA